MLETRGKPVACYAVDTFARTVGKAMSRLHGFPSYPLVEIPSPFFESTSPSDEDFEVKCQMAVAKAEELLFSGRMT